MPNRIVREGCTGCKCCEQECEEDASNHWGENLYVRVVRPSLSDCSRGAIDENARDISAAVRSCPKIRSPSRLQIDGNFAPPVDGASSPLPTSETLIAGGFQHGSDLGRCWSDACKSWRDNGTADERPRGGISRRRWHSEERLGSGAFDDRRLEALAPLEIKPGPCEQSEDRSGRSFR